MNWALKILPLKNKSSHYKLSKYAEGEIVFFYQSARKSENGRSRLVEQFFCSAEVALANFQLFRSIAKKIIRYSTARFVSLKTRCAARFRKKEK